MQMYMYNVHVQFINIHLHIHVQYAPNKSCCSVSVQQSFNGVTVKTKRNMNAKVAVKNCV